MSRSSQPASCGFFLLVMVALDVGSQRSPDLGAQRAVVLMGEPLELAANVGVDEGVDVLALWRVGNDA